MKSNWALTPARLGRRITPALLARPLPRAGRWSPPTPPRPAWQGDKLQFLTIIDRSVFLHFL